MDKGFLNRKSTSMKHVDEGSMEKGSLLSNLAGKIKNIDGKMISKDGKPMVAHRCVHSSDAAKNPVCDWVQDARNVDKDGCVKPNDIQPMTHITDSNDSLKTMHSDSQTGMVKEAVNCPDKGLSIPMVNDTCSPIIRAHMTNQKPSLAVAIPKEVVDEVKLRFVNTLYGYSVGKRLAFPLVENYVKHAWERFGLKRVMSHLGMFLFQFETKEGMVKVMEGGPWRINLVPIILKIWMPNTLLKKEAVSSVLLWMKMHNVPIVAYLKVGLDVIAAKVGKLIRLDAHTTSICLNSWGRSDYARALVEVAAETPLINSVDVEIPLDEEKGHIMTKVDIEYEWQPPRCGTCKVFNHLEALCPKKQFGYPKKLRTTEDKGKQVGTLPMGDTGRKNEGKQVGIQRYIKGFRVNNPKTKLVYRAVVKPQSVNHVNSNMEQSSNTTMTPSPPDSSKNGIPNYINDDINFDELRTFVDKTMEEESVLEYIGHNTKDGYSDTDGDEVFLPDDGFSLPSSSFGGGQQLEDEILNAYDDYEDQFEEYSSLYQNFCDQFDFKLKSYGRK
ncbi:zinc knuckle CX2CX4HX4C containing protein [Tanacetum coccineum]